VGGAIIAEACELVTQIAEKITRRRLPQLMGPRWRFSSVHEQFFVVCWACNGPIKKQISMHNADCILALGARFDDRVDHNVAKFVPHATIIHVDIDPASISKL